MICKFCNKEISDMSVFCTYCGHKVEGNSEIESLIKMFHENNPDALKYGLNLLEKDSNNSEILYWVGSCYYDGIGTDINVEEAKNYYYKATEFGHIKAKYWYGYCLLLEDDKGAIKYIVEAASAGYENALVVLGRLYKYGYPQLSIVSDIKKSIEFFEKATEVGSIDALAELGDLYYCCYDGRENQYISYDYLNSYFNKAASEKDMDTETMAVAYLNFGRCYQFGVGVEENLQKAEECFVKALEISPENELFLYQYARCLLDEKKDESIKLFEDLYEKYGYVTAGYELFNLYLKGKLTDKPDLYKSLIWIDKLASRFSTDLTLDEHDKKACELAYNERIVLFAEPDSPLTSEYELLPTVKEKYPEIYEYLSEKVLERHWFIWLERDATSGKDLNLTYIVRSINKTPYFCVDELEWLSVVENRSPLSGNPSYIDTAVMHYHNNSADKNEYKAQYWRNKLWTLACNGNAHAQAILVQSKRILDGLDSSETSGFNHLSELFVNTKYHDIEEAFLNSVKLKDRDALTYYGRYVAKNDNKTEDEIKEILQEAANAGAGDAWYFLGLENEFSYNSDTGIRLEGIKESEEGKRAAECYKKSIDCNNGYFINEAKDSLSFLGVEYERYIPKENVPKHSVSVINNQMHNIVDSSVNNELDDLYDSAEKSLIDGMYVGAQKYFEEILRKEPGEWKAEFFIQTIELLGCTYDDSDHAIRSLSEISSSVCNRIKGDLNEKYYVGLIVRMVTKVAIHINTLQADKFNESIGNPMGAYQYISPATGFYNLTLIPRAEKIGNALFKFGDDLDVLGYSDWSSRVFEIAIGIYDLTLANGTFSEKRDRKAKIRFYKSRIRKG